MRETSNLKQAFKKMSVFRDDVSFILMEEPPLPDDVAEPLWKIIGDLNQILEKMAVNYLLERDDETKFIPQG
ncbi:MAG: hypothetical protein V4610_15820 [Pseudomonadota bacterium]|jgi:hypothetical protein